MGKCVVSGCPNRSLNVNRGILNRPPKRFFSFPKDPARVKVWLAALRETDKQDSAEQHLICEDHFLPEDLSSSGVNTDAIPIMPPYLDGPLGVIGPWGADMSEDEDAWAAGGEEEEEEEDAGEEEVVAPVNVEPSAPEPSEQDPGEPSPTETKMTSANLHQREPILKVGGARRDLSLGLLTRRFLELLLVEPDRSLELGQATTSLQTSRRRLYDITNILESISLVERTANRVKWIGTRPISSFLWKSKDKFQRELENLKLVESTLDGLIKSCAQQLFDMTDDLENSTSAYVTHQDVRSLAAFQEQTLIVVKAPEETKLEVPAPTEDSIQIHLKGERGPIMVLTCDIETAGEKSSCFVTLEESRIRTSTLKTGRAATNQPLGGATCPQHSDTVLEK
ncbi:transcription factor E2F6 [Aulostomus maculatus]